MLLWQASDSYRWPYRHGPGVNTLATVVIGGLVTSTLEGTRVDTHCNKPVI